MRYYAIDTHKKQGQVDILHHVLFHGDMLRADYIASESHSHYMHSDLSHPVLLTRTGTYIPPIFKPGNSLIMTEDVASLISGIQNIKIVPAIPYKLINYWKKCGDFSFYDSIDYLSDPNTHRPDSILDWMPNDISLFARFPLCYEIAAYNVFHADESNTVSKVCFTMNNDRCVDVEFSCPTHVIDTYPIIWGIVPMLRYDIYYLIDDKIDHDHFAVKQIEI